MVHLFSYVIFASVDSVMTDMDRKQMELMWIFLFLLSQITYTEEFMQLPPEKLKGILQRNSLSVQTEDVIFDSIMRWVRSDIDNRRQCIQSTLTECVHMGLLDERYLHEYVVPDELIRSVELEGLLLRMHREDANPKQRGFTNMVIVTGGEGPCEK